MPTPDSFDHKLTAAAPPVFASGAVRFVSYLGLCATYLQSGLVKLTDFEHLGLFGGFLLVAWLDLREKRA